MIQGTVIIRKAWRSELPAVIVLVVACIGAVLLSHIYPRSVITGPILSFGDYLLSLSLPLFWLVPFVVFGYLTFRIYNVRYEVTSETITSFEGILNFHQRIVKIRHEDVRTIETDQSIIERLLDVGEVEIATAGTGQIEVEFQGVESPVRLQAWLQGVREEARKRGKLGVTIEKSTHNIDGEGAEPDPLSSRHSGTRILDIASPGNES